MYLKKKEKEEENTEAIPKEASLHNP